MYMLSCVCVCINVVSCVCVYVPPRMFCVYVPPRVCVCAVSCMFVCCVACVYICCLVYLYSCLVRVYICCLVCVCTWCLYCEAEIDRCCAVCLYCEAEIDRCCAVYSLLPMCGCPTLVGAHYHHALHVNQLSMCVFGLGKIKLSQDVLSPKLGIILSCLGDIVALPVNQNITRSKLQPKQ